MQIYSRNGDMMQLHVRPVSAPATDAVRPHPNEPARAVNIARFSES